MKKINKKIRNSLFFSLVFLGSVSAVSARSFETVHEWIEHIEKDIARQSPHFYDLYRKLPLEEKLVILQDKLRADEDAQTLFSEMDLIQKLFPEV